MNTNRLSQQDALEFLRSRGVQGTEAELIKLINLCDHQPLALERVAALLCQLANCQAHNFNEPEVLTAVIEELIRSNFPLLALRFYKDGYDGYIEFGLKRGEFRLGLRLNSAFEQLDISSLPASQIRNDSGTVFLPIQHDRALFLMDIGELKPAEILLRELAWS